MLMKRLLEAIRNVGQAIQHNTDKITEATKTANAKQSVPPEVRAEVSLPQGIQTRKSAGDSSDDRKYQHRTLLVSWLTLTAIIIYSALVYFQWREMQKIRRLHRTQQLPLRVQPIPPTKP